MALAPRFSIVICNWNYAGFVGAAIASALAQDYASDRFEVIPVDDGSTDGSREVIEHWAAADGRVRPVFQDNRGQAAAFAAGVAEAGGDYICLLDSDDLFHRHKLRRVAQRIMDLGGPSGSMFLCHDLDIRDERADRTLDQGWFDVIGVNRLGGALSPQDISTPFPFSIPTGQVYARELVGSCLDAMPTWAFRRGADGALCPAALLKVGRVHYLKERLGVYRVHGENEFARIVDGHYDPQPLWRARIPKLLRFLEQWVDALDLAPPERAERLTGLRRLEYVGRIPSASRRLDAPLVSVILVDVGNARHLVDTAESVLEQSHGAVQLVLPQSDDALAARLASWGRPLRFVPVQEGDDLSRLAAGYFAADGEYVLFLRAGDRLDRECLERHLFWRQHGALVGVSCCDVRLASENSSLIHADCFANSGAWKQQLQQIPPLATGLREWLFPPLAACLVRRGELLDRMLSARPDSMPEALRVDGAWLLLQFAHLVAGTLRIRETLATHRVNRNAVAGYGYLAGPPTLDGRLGSPDVSLGRTWLEQFYRSESDAFQHWLPETWHRRFAIWLAAQAAEG